MWPVSTVALGLANAAIIIGGTVVLITAIGALLSIQGFENFVDKGIQRNSKDVFNGIAKPRSLPLLGVTVGMVVLGIVSCCDGFIWVLANISIIIGGMVGLITAIGGFALYSGSR